MCRYFINPYRKKIPDWDKKLTHGFDSEDITSLHRSIHEYKPTPLVELTSLAENLGVGRLLVKDESYRFGLNAFKAMGATYAVFRFLKDHFERQGKTVPDARDFYRNTDWLEPNEFTFCTATDGNHGRGVAWTAHKLGQKAVIYMPGFSVKARIENIEKEGAKVVIVDGSYDDAVSKMIEDAYKNYWQIISDHSWTGYTQIPEWIKAGYLTMFREIDDALGNDNNIDIVIVQVGVGALAAAVSYYYNRLTAGKRAMPVGVEPVQADCIFQSISSESGEPLTIGGKQDSIMAGLNCATPSLTAWPFLKQGIDMFLAIADDDARRAMRQYYYPIGDDPRIISGESGAAGLAALTALTEKPSLAEARDKLKLDKDTTVLVLNTEGDTDPVSFRKIIEQRS